MADQLRGQRRQTIVFPVRPTVFDCDVSIFVDASFTQSLTEGIRYRRWVLGTLVKKSNQRFRGRLRLDASRRCEHGSDASDEHAPVHSVT